MTTPQPAIPYLESGDRLTRAEFERRYNAMPDGFKAELIEGVVSVASPVRFATHSEPHSRIITLLGVYAAATPASVSAITQPCGSTGRMNSNLTGCCASKTAHQPSTPMATLRTAGVRR